MVDRVQRIMKQPQFIRNIGVCAHIDHGKTTFSDNLLAGAGMMSEEKAGKQLVLDFHADEQARGITIDAANVSMVHTYDGKEFLINMIDTPGHIDFGGDVTRAMRAVDGAIVLVDAVEGVMPQTETVLRQALKERVKPVLFINKCDRLIKELKLTPQQMQERLLNVISAVNKFVQQICPDEFKGKWPVDVQAGSVAFGSAFHNWALSFPYMQRNKLSFKDIIEAYEKDDSKSLAKKAPLHAVILDMVVKHHPNPLEAQKYRIPKIWHGDFDSEVGKSLLTADPNGPVVFVVTKVVVDPHAGEISAGRLFSGTIKQGQEVYTISSKGRVRLQQISIYNGPKRETVDSAPAGNIIGVVGVKNSFAGETVASIEMEPFEALTHLFEPVVTLAVKANNPADLPKLIDVLKQVNKEDPSIIIEINEESGEHLMHGMGELHLEVITNRIRTEKGVQITTSPPIVVYRESILGKGQEFEGKSPNKHNKFYFVVEPLDERIRHKIKEGEISEGRIKKKDMALRDILVECGMDNKDALKVKAFHKGNMLLDGTRGIVHIGEVIELVMDMFEDVMNHGPLGKEPCFGVKVTINDLKLHEDAIHRGPAQVYPAVRDGIRGTMMTARPVLFEPVQILQFEAPEEFMGDLTKLIANKRGQLLDLSQEKGMAVAKAKMPVAELMGLSNDLRSATGGRGHSFLIDQLFERLPDELQQKVRSGIMQRKGLTIDPETGMAK
ncbi:TPA: elongation factor EF-2 [Candidatus Woesearchaeota archaeon]|nr:elongation factor EF-2 [Candidatus Woesearchaeota archaeon]